MLNFNRSNDASSLDVGLENPKDAPEDTVSNLKWFPDLNMFLFAASSWDGTIRMYDIATQGNPAIRMQTAMNLKIPILTFSFIPGQPYIVSGAMDGSVHLWEIQSGKSQLLGKHASPVKEIFWEPQNNCAITVSFDRTLKVWQLNQSQPIFSLDLLQTPFSADMSADKFVIGLNTEKVMIGSLSNLMAYQDASKRTIIDSPLGPGSQLQSVCITEFGPGKFNTSSATLIGLGTNDGRVNLSGLLASVGGTEPFKLDTKMTFKAHKVSTGSNTEVVFPVNSLSYNVRERDFVATGGGEGAITFWDYGAKNKIQTFEYGGTPVTRLRMRDDGSLMVYALGYDWSEGIYGLAKHKTRLHVHVINDNELKYTATNIRKQHLYVS